MKRTVKEMLHDPRPFSGGDGHAPPPSSLPPEILEMLSSQARSAVEGLLVEQQQMSAFDQMRMGLFPSRIGPTGTIAAGLPPSQGIEGGLSNFLTTRTTEQESFTDPETGAIELPNGVIINPNMSPGESGSVTYAPNSTAPGSFGWLRKVATSWSVEKTNDWRDKLNKLGYGVAKKGKFDATLASQLDVYFRNKYFFGSEVPADGSVGTKAGARAVATDAYDPIQMKQDIRVAFKAAIGDDPTESELDTFYKQMRSTMVQTITKGATPQHAALKSQEQLSEGIIDSPAGQTAQRRSDAQGLENTDLMDSFVSLGQLMS